MFSLREVAETARWVMRMCSPGRGGGFGCEKSIGDGDLEFYVEVYVPFSFKKGDGGPDQLGDISNFKP